MKNLDDVLTVVEIFDQYTKLDIDSRELFAKMIEDHERKNIMDELERLRKKLDEA